MLVNFKNQNGLYNDIMLLKFSKSGIRSCVPNNDFH